MMREKTKKMIDERRERVKTYYKNLSEKCVGSQKILYTKVFNSIDSYTDTDIQKMKGW